MTAAILMLLLSGAGSASQEVTAPQAQEPHDPKDEAALDCLKKWRFTPAIKKGKPVATIANAPVAFKIE